MDTELKNYMTTNKYLEKIAARGFKPKEGKPNSVWSKEEFQPRFQEMFEHSLKKGKIKAEDVKSYRWKNTIGIPDSVGRLGKLMVASRKEGLKNLILTHKDYKDK